MSNLPLVSILVPIYGVERYIERCAISLFNQSYPNCEFVFVNDCTPDQSMLILRRTIDKFYWLKNRISIIEHETNKGIGATRNSLLEAGKGHYILFVDSDDYVETNYVESLVSTGRGRDADLVIMKQNGSKNVICTVDVERYKKKILLRKTPPCVWGKLFVRNIIVKGNLQFVQGIDHCEDFMFVSQYVTFVKSIFVINDCLYHYTIDNVDSYTSNFTEKSVKSIIRSLKQVRTFYLKQNANNKNILDLSALEYYRGFLEKKVEKKIILKKYYIDFLNDLSLTGLSRIALVCLEKLPLIFSKLLFKILYYCV